jgi:hypothetical protein
VGAVCSVGVVGAVGAGAVVEIRFRGLILLGPFCRGLCWLLGCRGGVVECGVPGPLLDSSG